jgi:hypothetical protein
MIDDLARTAVRDLRASTTSDVEAGLLEVYAGHRRRHLQTAWTAAAAVVLALGMGWWGGHAMSGDHPATSQPTGQLPSVQTRLCSGPVRCLGTSTYRFALARPVTWHVPDGYDVSSGSVSEWSVETRAQSLAGGGGPYQYHAVAGVTVLEGVRAASADGGSTRAGVAGTPHAFVTWLAGQPYLDASSVTRTRVDGREAWHVRVTLADGAGDGPAVCDGTFACYATTLTPDHQMTGIRGDMIADYTAFHVPDAGTTVVWSWAFSRDRAALARNRIAVRGLSWLDG